MKHKFLIMAVAIALVLSMTACSSGGEVEAPNNVSVGSEETLGLAASTETQAVETGVSEMVLVDEAGVKITAKRLDTTGLFGPELKLLIENDSGKDLTIQTRNASVNGYMVETMMSVDVVNGKKANDGITFMDSDLDACGITTIADMEFSFHIFTTADWETYLDTDVIRVETTAAAGYAYTFDDSGDMVHNEDSVKIVVKGLSEDTSLLGPSIVVYIANTGSEGVTVQVRDVSINGFMVDGIFSCEVMPGKHAVDTITFWESELEENQITEISQVELSFHIFETDDWDTIADTETVHITFG